MFRAFLALALLVLIASGCVTTGTTASPQTQELQIKIGSLETELKKAQDENLLLKQQISQLQKLTEALAVKQEPEKIVEEKIIVRMPSGNDIQQALKNAGFYKGEVDGQIGTQTKESIKKFQEANKLNPDGVVGSRTWELLEKHLKAE